MFEITCGTCGKSSPTEQWLERPSGLKLPANCFQCPACGVAIKKTFGPPTVCRGQDGEPLFAVPGKVKLERVQPWL